MFDPMIFSCALNQEFDPEEPRGTIKFPKPWGSKKGVELEDALYCLVNIIWEFQVSFVRVVDENCTKH